MIIESLLDTDLYKFTMMQVVLHHFPTAQVEYRFKCRTPDVDLTPYVGEIEREIGGLCGLRFHPGTRLPAPLALPQERFCRSAGPVSPRRALCQRTPVAVRPGRDRDHDRGTVAAHDPLRGADPRHRQRGVLPE
jgi:hypothetical protein